MKEHDPEMYYKCAQPHDTMDEAIDKTNEFLRLVQEAREKCRMENVVMLVQFNAMDGSKPKRLSADLQLGDSAQWKRMAFTLAGILRQREDVDMARLLGAKEPA